MSAQTLPETIDLVQSGLDDARARVGKYDDDPHDYHRRRRTEMDALAIRLAASVDAKITERTDGARVCISGITSTSTSGISGALQNWLIAARKRGLNNGRAGPWLTRQV